MSVVLISSVDRVDMPRWVSNVFLLQHSTYVFTEFVHFLGTKQVPKMYLIYIKGNLNYLRSS